MAIETANTLAAAEVALLSDNFELGLFGPIELPLPPRSNPAQDGKTVARRLRPVLSWRDFILPELVSRSKNGDPSVKSISSPEQEEQTLHLMKSREELRPQLNETRERKQYAQSLKRDPDRAAELAAFLAGSAEGEEEFGLWLERKLDRRARALEKKANRLLNCSVTARPMDCLDCGLKGFVRFYCGNRYCRYCGEHVFRQLFAKYIRLQAIVERIMCRNGFRPTAVLATFTFTTANLDRMPTAEEIRQFNEDVRTTIRMLCRQLGISASQFGAIWCDEFGGWNPKTHDYNTNLHCHGIWLGPFLPLKLVSAVWNKVRGNNDYRVVIESVPFYEGKPDFARALGHALKYTSKHVSKYSPERLAELELAFNGVRRVHTMGMFYNAQEVRLDEPAATPLCPSCNGHLAYPKNSTLQLVMDLVKDGRVDLAVVRSEKKTVPKEVPS